MFLSKSETQKRSKGKGRKTQFCLVSAQLRDVSFFENLKQVDNVFCVSKCHSWKFRETVLSFIRPKENSVFAIRDTKGLKLLTRLGLNFGHWNEHKFRHGFKDIVDPMCKWGLETETTFHFLLCCRLYSAIRAELMGDISAANSSLTNYPDEKLLNILLYGLEYFSVKTNRSILKSTIKFLKSFERFDDPLFL